MDEIKIAISFALGIGTGVLASRMYFKNKYSEIADKEIADVKHAYFQKYEANRSEELEEEKEESSNIYEDNSSIDYVRITEKIDAQKKEVMDRVLANEHPEDDKAEEPYEITEDEYSDTELSYDKDVLHFFVDDEVIFDPGKGIVVERSVLGEDNVELIANSVDVYSLYFRDDKFGKDYEVIKTSGAFYEGV